MLALPVYALFKCDAKTLATFVTQPPADFTTVWLLSPNHAQGGVFTLTLLLFLGTQVTLKPSRTRPGGQQDSADLC